MGILNFLRQQQMQIEKENPSFSTLLDNLPQVPHLEGILEDDFAETVGGDVAALQQREVHAVVGLLRYRQHDFKSVLLTKCIVLVTHRSTKDCEYRGNHESTRAK